MDNPSKDEIAVKKLLYNYYNYRSEKSLEYALDFKPPKNTCIISAHPKCGTTMTQQVI